METAIHYWEAGMAGLRPEPAIFLGVDHRPLWPKQGPSTSKLDRRVSDQKAAKELANIIRQLRVAKRPSCQLIRCRKAVSEVSLPVSGHRSPSADDPDESFAFQGYQGLLRDLLLTLGSKIRRTSPDNEINRLRSCLGAMKRCIPTSLNVTG